MDEILRYYHHLKVHLSIHILAVKGFPMRINRVHGFEMHRLSHSIIVMLSCMHFFSQTGEKPVSCSPTLSTGQTLQTCLTVMT